MIHILTSAEFSLWDAFVRNSVQANPFATTAFAKAYQKANPKTSFRVFVQKEEGEIKGGILVYEKRQFGKMRLIVPPLVPFTTYFPSATFETSDFEAKIETDRLFWREFMPYFDAIHSAFHPHFPISAAAIFPTDSKEIILNSRYTFWCKPMPLPTFLSHWTTKSRTKFRGAQKDLMYKTGDEFLHKVLDWVESSFARHRRTIPLAKDRLVEMIQEMPHEMRQVSVLVDTFGNIQAGVVLLLYQGSAYYWLAGSMPTHHPEARKNAMFALIPLILDDLASKGYSNFDFVGANTESINQFKRKFLPERVPYMDIMCYQSRLLKYWDAARRRL